MQLAPEQVRKPIRELGKTVRAVRKNPPQETVHHLRIRSRKVEAISAALMGNTEHKPRKLLKAIKPLRKTAGKVRDMDVLEANVRSLLHRRHDPSFERLLAHLRNVRADCARALVDEIKSEQENVLHRLKRFLRRVKKRSDFDAAQAQVVFDELSRWPRLTADNLHDFRIKVKELRYMMQLVNGANSDFMNALDYTKVQIGVWHDWLELHNIASEVLNQQRDRRAITEIADIATRKFASAMRSASLLRSRYLRTHDLAEFAEP